MIDDTIVYKLFAQERERQDKLWGGLDHDRGHTLEEWLAFIRKQCDDAEKIITEEKYTRVGTAIKFMYEMQQIGALATAAIVAVDASLPDRGESR